MMQLNLEKICQQVITLTNDVGEFIVSHQNKISKDQIEIKALNSLVSFVDQNAEKDLVKGLSEIFPEAGFITEEKTIATKTEVEYIWVIDPLDGTTNFLHGLPCYSISIALKKNDDYILGVIRSLPDNHVYSAWLNGGAYKNGIPISVSDTRTIKESLLATGFPYNTFGTLENYLNLFRYLMKNTRGIRRFGSAAIDLAYVAEGSFDGFFEYGLNEWDVAAGICLVKEAGGHVTDFKGTNKVNENRTILATNQVIHQELGGSISTYFHR